MVVWFNKWLIISFFVVSILENGSDAPSHPLHMGVVEIEFNEAEKSLEITCKLFTDDFEHILEKTYDTNIDLINPSNREEVQKWVNAYVKKHLLLKVDGKAINIECIGFEKDFEATYSYFQALNIDNANSFEIQSSLMYDLFDDQSNILHVIVKGKRKSMKLRYPEKSSVVEFSK